MKKFENPELQIISFGEDIITTSSTPTIKSENDNTDDNYGGLVFE